MPRVMMVAGEASADHHGALVHRELCAMAPGIEVFGAAGPAMVESGVESLVPMEVFSVMGILGVLKALPRAWSAMQKLKRIMSSRRPDCLVLIDCPEVNLPLATYARRRGIPVIYFISPQVWAWRSGRVKRIRRDVTRMLTILPFEETFYAQTGVNARFVGHPLIDALSGMSPRAPKSENGFVVGLLPGSRRSEISRILPVLQGTVTMLQQHIPQSRFKLYVAPGIEEREVSSVGPSVSVEKGMSWVERGDLDAAVVTSGTAALEMGILGVPLVVVYRTDPLSFAMAKRLVKCRHICLLNLIADEPFVPELIQDHATPERISHEISGLLTDGERRASMRKGFQIVRDRLGGPGCARRVAEEILKLSGEREGKG